ncbi:uncharacterized protein LOC105218590 [Zeugodacus cucurbitae]|uniref:CTP synthase n=1 Tax=Zeugodacus cucurbitae TaxID=28588 RepID=A0A0A1XRA5_ZEUCU|nr:uncharacterized protein LOC105218590 [Zeugodacus cucurbitae]
MENETQTQPQLERHEAQLLQQAPVEAQAEQTEDMGIVTEEILSDACVTNEDSSTCMCVQEADYESANIASEAEALQQLECEAEDEQQYAHHVHRQYNPKKSVSFKTLVDIFQLSDAWQLHVKKSSLKTEEDQAKRRILQRNY